MLPWRLLQPLFLTALLTLVLTTCMNDTSAIARAALPPTAQAAMNRGLDAAKLHDWDLAIKYFKEAQKAAPDYPSAMFHLAQAYDSAKWRELLALCWYHAYLAADPAAPNATQVRQRIGGLKVAIKDNMRKLVVLTADSVAQLPRDFDTTKSEHLAFWSTNPRLFGHPRDDLMSGVAVTLALSGDIAGAYRTVDEQIKDQNTDGQPNQYDTYSQIAAALFEIGDLTGARLTLAKIPDNDNKDQIDSTERRALIREGRYCVKAGRPSTAKWENLAATIGTSSSGIGSVLALPKERGESQRLSQRPMLARSNLRKFLISIKSEDTWDMQLEIQDSIEQMSVALAEIRSCEQRSEMGGRE